MKILTAVTTATLLLNSSGIATADGIQTIADLIARDTTPKQRANSNGAGKWIKQRHASARQTWTSIDADGHEKTHTQQRLLVVTWLVDDGMTAMEYTVHRDGLVSNIRHVYSWAHQGNQSRTLKTQQLENLTTKLNAMEPADGEPPPLRNSVHVSWTKNEKWITTTFDSRSLPDDFEHIMKIVGERSETLGRHSADGRQPARPRFILDVF